jgi:hypothetical protein
VTTAGGGIVQVVGEQHLAHAERVVQADHVDVAIERVHALDIERQRELVVGAGAIDIGGSAGQHEAVAVL